jgi:uncharacterized protein
MQKVIVNSLVAAAFGVMLAGSALADTDPTVHQIYEAAQSGQLQRAQEMMDQVLRDHPDSSKAHYVQSELYAREGKINLARAQFDRAEELSPGLSKENPRSVAELKAELGLTPRMGSTTGVVRESAPRIPWGAVLVIFALVLGAVWMFSRRRPAYPQYPAPGMPGGGPMGYPPGYAPGSGPGIGSSIAGGLAGGLAAGAGIVAGEEIARNLLEGSHRNPSPLVEDDGSNGASNSDMGGADFGVDDPGSWDDGSGGGGGSGGDDWT